MTHGWHDDDDFAHGSMGTSCMTSFLADLSARIQHLGAHLHTYSHPHEETHTVFLVFGFARVTA